ncbi:MAG TPA: hypothetical protein PKJ19_00295 [Flavobacteriales bacterium]|nr:hypothetical protein [Flavobacteriales bacterium]HNU55739.1 hypothetical protein [Flavobacteriales bacterium]
MKAIFLLGGTGRIGMSTGTNRMNIRIGWYWLAVVAALLALVVDVIDGQTTKTIGTMGVLVGFLGLALWRKTRRPWFNWLAVVGFLIFIGLTVHRLAIQQGWIG